jgi:hypothetical protein
MFVLSLFLPRHGTAEAVARSGSDGRNDEEVITSEPPEAVAIEV